MEIDKRELILLVNEITSEIDVKKAVKDDGSKGRGIGTSQFRDMASICKSAESFEEVKLLLRYKMAKDNKRSSWRQNISGTTFGDVLLGKIDNIYNVYGDEKCLAALSLFFGYLYQSARLWKAEF